MFKIKELTHILIALVLFTFVIWFSKDAPTSKIPIAFIIAFVVLSVNIIAKKLAAIYDYTEIELKIWQFQRWGYYERSHLKTPVPAGVLFPFILILLSYPTGFIKALTFLETDLAPTSARHAKIRGGLRRFYELKDSEQALIIAVGIIANLMLSLVFFLIGANQIIIDTAKYSAFFCLWNLIPISHLDGTKILFGRRALWAFLIICSLILTIAAFFV